jgi:hypothetical protein
MHVKNYTFLLTVSDRRNGKTPNPLLRLLEMQEARDREARFASLLLSTTGKFAGSFARLVILRL